MGKKLLSQREYILLFVFLLLIFIWGVPLGNFDKLFNTKLTVLINENCKNMLKNDRITFTVSKVGGGYNSGEFIVDMNQPEGMTLDLPDDGNYNIKGTGVMITEFSFQKPKPYYWNQTINVQDEVRYKCSCK